MPSASCATVASRRSASRRAATPSRSASVIAGLPPRLALVVGAEGPGLTSAALASVDRTVRIPMAAGVDSVNVATAAAIALSALFGRLTPDS